MNENFRLTNIENGEKRKFIITLPRNLSIRGYLRIKKIGGIVATKPAGAVSQYLHREFIRITEKKNPREAKIAVNELKRLGSLEEFACEVDFYQTKTDLIQGDKTSFKEFRHDEILYAAHFLDRKYGYSKNNGKIAKKILEEFDLFKN